MESKKYLEAILNVIGLGTSLLNVSLVSHNIRKTQTLLDDKLQDIVIIMFLFLSFNKRASKFLDVSSKYSLFVNLFKTSLVFIINRLKSE